MPEPTEMDIDSSEVADEAHMHDSKSVVLSSSVGVDNKNKNEEEEEDVEELLDLIDQAKVGAADSISLLKQVTESLKSGPKATQIKERAVYDLTRAYCKSAGSSAGSSSSGDEQKYSTHIVSFLESSQFFATVNKAKCAKVVRQVLEIVCGLAPLEYTTQQEICEQIIVWCHKLKRSFLRQRVEAKLASILFQQQAYGDALLLIDRLLGELKKLDDKQLLVETHLLECKIHFGLRNVPKAKSALTASRTAANAIYVAPLLQASIDTMSGTIQTEEADYNTAHSYFLEAFEQLDQLKDATQAIKSLKYMMLCRILDSLTKTLQLSSKGSIGAAAAAKSISSGGSGMTATLDISTLVTSRQAVKYAGRELEAMTAIAKAACDRSLHDYEKVLQEYATELQSDLLIKHHLQILQEQLLESNLNRIMEPYSCVEVTHIAELMKLSLPTIEKKLSQMILDGKLQGILDQGKGQLIIYEETHGDKAMSTGLDVLASMDEVVTTLFERSKALRTLML